MLATQFCGLRSVGMRNGTHLAQNCFITPGPMQQGATTFRCIPSLGYDSHHRSPVQRIVKDPPRVQSRLLHSDKRTSRLSCFLTSIFLVAALAGSMTAAQAPGAPAGQTTAAPAPHMPQGGKGPLKVLVITRGHEYDREPFNQMFDALGNDITWTHVEHPAADTMLAPENAKNYDVYVFYDLAGPGVRVNKPDGSFERTYPPPTPEAKKNFTALVKSGKGMVFLHHSIAGYAHT